MSAAALRGMGSAAGAVAGRASTAPGKPASLPIGPFGNDRAGRLARLLTDEQRDETPEHQGDQCSGNALRQPTDRQGWLHAPRLEVLDDSLPALLLLEFFEQRGRTTPEHVAGVMAEQGGKSIQHGSRSYRRARHHPPSVRPELILRLGSEPRRQTSAMPASPAWPALRSAFGSGRLRRW